jgi:hypothetical protein
MSVQDKSGMVNQAATGGEISTQEPPTPPPSTPMGAGLGAIEDNPAEGPDEPASEEEQAQHDDLFIRVMAAVNDIRKPKGGKESMADAVIRMLSTKDKEAYLTIGRVAGIIMSQMTDLAKRSKVEYPGEVIRDVGTSLVIELIELAEVSGAIKNIPPEDSEERDKLTEMSALEAAKVYGEWQIHTGQANKAGAQQDMQNQMQREADSGELDDWGMEELDPETQGQLVQRLQGQPQPPQQGQPPQAQPSQA